MTTFSQTFVDGVLADGYCIKCHCGTWIVKVTGGRNAGLFSTPSFKDNTYRIAELSDGAQLQVQSASRGGLNVIVLSNPGLGQPVATGDKPWATVQQTGWVADFRTDYVSGTPTDAPYIQPAANGRPERDGSPDTAVAWAASWIGTGANPWGGAPTATPIKYPQCLAFVSTAFGIPTVPKRCPEIGNAGSAYAAYTALKDRLETALPPPTGAILFWDGAPAGKGNGGAGHIAIMGSDGLVITTGAVSSHDADYQGKAWYHPDVWTGTIDDITKWTEAPFVGYVEADKVFAPGLWGGITCRDAAPPS